MKIGIISEPPPLTTGFAKTCKYIVEAIIKSGNTPACFGLNLFGETFDRLSYPYSIWAVGRYNLSTSLHNFLEYEKPDSILINADLPSVCGWILGIKSMNYPNPIYSHFVLDCLPVRAEYLNIIKQLDKAIVPTRGVLKYLQEQGFDKAIYAPHGVDKKNFKRIKNREDFKKIAGLEGKFLVGVFGQNIERKQHPRVLLAARILKEKGYKDRIAFYFHCQPKEKPDIGWDLPELAQFLEVDDMVLFPNENFRHSMGIPMQSEKPSPNNIQDLGYVQRINMCDMIVNVSYSGGFELGILEAQACEVPVCVTNDTNILAEVAGKGAYLLKAEGNTFWEIGGYKYCVNPETIAEAILELMHNKVLRQQIVDAGIKNIRCYTWTRLIDAVQQCLDL